MIKFILSLLCFFIPSFVFSKEVNTIYHNIALPESEREEILVQHARDSFEKTLRFESKLSSKDFTEISLLENWREKYILQIHNINLSKIVDFPYLHLLNNLCSLPKASHLHVGLLAGDSFIASLYGNQSSLDQQLGVDWFQECSEEVFYKNCNCFLDPKKYKIINGECFNFSKSIFEKPIDIYFYDADHSLRGHQKAFSYYNDLLADIFIVVIDDWDCSWIRCATFKAFEQLDYTTLYQNVLTDLTHQEKMQYLAVIRKSTVEAPVIHQRNFPTRSKLLDREKQKVFKAIEGGWCSPEKASVLMDIIFESKPQVCVEIGVFSGSSFLPIVFALSQLGQGHAFAIDSWSNREAVRGIPFSEHYEWWSSVDMQAAYRSFLNALSDPKLASYFTVIPRTSATAASQFEEIDFLHLDGSFSQEGALKDFELYFPKVKSEGYILLSNSFFSIDNEFTKAEIICALIEKCEVIDEIDNNNTILFRKI